MSVGLALENNTIPFTKRTHFFDQIKDIAAGMFKKQRTPVSTTNPWNNFFLTGEGVSDDFLAERGTQYQSPREAF